MFLTQALGEFVSKSYLPGLHNPPMGRRRLWEGSAKGGCPETPSFQGALSESLSGLLRDTNHMPPWAHSLLWKHQF